ncbi:MAG: hypothetical protein M1322_02435 [Candidatus Parvarchaeota archaeon]|jgi:hypothetical protein|nr:hypothetical protein [Candidatus Parvarchaeota archaeon]MCL5106948.1 hypothetical protein [Candidatus Parvarchaeota archaeon]
MTVKTVLAVGSSYYFILTMLPLFSGELKSNDAVKMVFNGFDESLTEAIRIAAKSNGFSAEFNINLKPPYILFTRL